MYNFLYKIYIVSNLPAHVVLGTNKTGVPGVHETLPTAPSTDGVPGDVSVSEEFIHLLQRDDVGLQDSLRNSEELSVTLQSELDLTRSILTQGHARVQGSPQTKHAHTQSYSSSKHIAMNPPQSPPDSRGISSGLILVLCSCCSHLWEFWS